MGMEGLIMYIEKCTLKMSLVAFLGPKNAPKLLTPRPHWGAYGAPQIPYLGLRAPTSKTPTSKGAEESGGEGSNDLCPERRKSYLCHCKAHCYAELAFSSLVSGNGQKPSLVLSTCQYLDAARGP